ncbi:hypothetical protein CKAH01_10743 [Colletotrichum kahawae]|uniref:Uncharacterized protein n=1 Tax=Colletotrichum kahawae TaxID=34407 RepID=A0AAD9XWJ4_COLKA|nr:hypothetical protein CKAH01_10743 [Colletotrichum kahawae]
MEQRIKEQEAELQAHKDRETGATSKEGDVDLELDDMSLDEPVQDVKKETQDEGLFVPRTLEDNTTLIVTDDDEDDPATLVSWKDISAQYQDDEMGNITTYGYLRYLNRTYWEKRKSEDKKNFKLPFTSIKLKWVTTRNGEKTVEKTFEMRSTVRSIFGMTQKAALRDYKIGEKVVLEEGTMMLAADLAIFAAAIISWDRYEEWTKEPSTGKDCSLTLDEVVQTMETNWGRKKAT